MKKYYLLLIFLFFIISIFCFTKIALAQIIINEIMYDLDGTDTDREWIEIFNNASSTIDLTNWRLYEQETNHKLTGDLIIPGGNYAVIVDKQENFLTDNPGYQGLIIDSAFSLKNDGEELAIKDSDLNTIDSVTYDPSIGANGNGKTLEKSGSVWQESSEIGGTPGAVNSAGSEPEPEEPEPEQDPGGGEITSGGGGSAAINQAPIANAGSDITALINQEISFSASESSDPDKDSLTFFWNFGDGAVSDEIKPIHTYQFPGQYIVSLLVSDGKLENTDTIIIDIYTAGLEINEFHPQDAWVEIYNNSENIINLANYQLNDFVFSENSLIAPFQYLVLPYQISQITLQDYLIFIYPNQQVIQEIQYDEPRTGWSINRISDLEYVWSNTPTPGTANLISQKSLLNQIFSSAGTGNADIVLAQDFSESKNLCNKSVCNLAPVLTSDPNIDNLQNITMTWPQIQVKQNKKALPIKAQANSGLISLWVSCGIAIVLLASWWVLKLTGRLRVS